MKRGTGKAQQIIDAVRRFLVPSKPVCTVCGRPLYATASIARGMGGVCAGKHKRKDEFTIDMFAGDKL